MQHALLRRAHDDGLRLLQRDERLVAVAGGERLLDLAERGVQARTPRLVDLGPLRDDTRRLAGRTGIRHTDFSDRSLWGRALKRPDAVKWEWRRSLAAIWRG